MWTVRSLSIPTTAVGVCTMAMQGIVARDFGQISVVLIAIVVNNLGSYSVCCVHSLCAVLKLACYGGLSYMQLLPCACKCSEVVFGRVSLIYSMCTCQQNIVIPVQKSSLNCI